MTIRLFQNDWLFFGGQIVEFRKSSSCLHGSEKKFSNQVRFHVQPRLGIHDYVLHASPKFPDRYMVSKSMNQGVYIGKNMTEDRQAQSRRADCFQPRSHNFPHLATAEMCQDCCSSCVHLHLMFREALVFCAFLVLQEQPALLRRRVLLNRVEACSDRGTKGLKCFNSIIALTRMWSRSLGPASAGGFRNGLQLSGCWG